MAAPKEPLGRHVEQHPGEEVIMKTALTRLTLAGAIALVFLATACIDASPTAPGGSRVTTTAPGDPPDETIKR